MTSTNSQTDTARLPGYPGLTLPLIRNAFRHGNETALIDGDRVFTWSEFEDRVARLAGAYAAMGAGPGARIGILAQNSHQIAENLFAALWLGAMAYPLNYRLAVPELRAQIEECEPIVFAVHGDFLDVAHELAPSMPATTRIVTFEAPPGTGHDDHEALIASSGRAPEAGARNDDVALLVYTGGTTGRSKGAMLTHSNLWANTFNVNPTLGITPASRYMLASPLFHVSALARMISTITAGASLVFLRRFTAKGMLETIERHKVAITTLVATMLKAMIEDPDIERYDLSSLKIISYGAAPSDDTLLRAVMKRLPRVDLWQAYGMTELAPTATQLAPEFHRDPTSVRLRSAGRPAALCEVRVADVDDNPLPTGEIGEIQVRGPNVMKGYWKKPELTQKALRGGWMHTGDLGHFDEDGFLYVVDRMDDMIISGGENIYTSEVENAVASHPKVRQCAVIGVSDPTWGQMVHVVVVPADGEAPTLEELQAHCRSLIAGYKLPRSIEIRTEPMPLSGVSKVLKATLRAEAEARRTAPDPTPDDL